MIGGVGINNGIYVRSGDYFDCQLESGGKCEHRNCR